MEPKIKAIGGYWYVWDDERSQYVHTGIKKATPKDDPKRNDLTTTGGPTHDH